MGNFKARATAMSNQIASKNPPNELVCDLIQKYNLPEHTANMFRKTLEEYINNDAESGWEKLLKDLFHASGEWQKERLSYMKDVDFDWHSFALLPTSWMKTNDVHDKIPEHATDEEKLAVLPVMLKYDMTEQKEHKIDIPNLKSKDKSLITNAIKESVSEFFSGPSSAALGLFSSPKYLAQYGTRNGGTKDADSAMEMKAVLEMPQLPLY